MRRKWLVVVCLGWVAMLAWGRSALAQGGPEPDPDVTLDWCDVQNGNALFGWDFSAPGTYEVDVPTFEGADFSSLPDDLNEITLDDLLDLQTGSETLVVRVEDRGVNCATGDGPGVERLWDDKLTAVIFRDANYDVSFYWPNGFHIHTTPYWKMLGNYRPGQMIDEHEILAGTLRLIFLGRGYYRMDWHGPDGGLALSIPFTYPIPCAQTQTGAPRVCDPPPEP